MVKKTKCFFAKRGRGIKTLRVAMNYERWGIVILHRIFPWGGNIARMSILQPDRLIVRVLAWRNNLELRTRQLLGEQQGHHGRFLVRRYENNFFTYFDSSGLHWKDVAI